MRIRLPHLLPAHFIGMAFAALIGAYVFDAFVPPVVFDWEAVRPGDILPGGNLIVDYSVTRMRSCPAIANRYVFRADGVGYPIQPVAVKAQPLAAHDFFTIKVPISPTALPGPAHFQLSVTFTCTLLGFLKSTTRSTGPILSL